MNQQTEANMLGTDQPPGGVTINATKPIINESHHMYSEMPHRSENAGHIPGMTHNCVPVNPIII